MVLCRLWRKQPSQIALFTQTVQKAYSTLDISSFKPFRISHTQFFAENAFPINGIDASRRPTKA